MHMDVLKIKMIMFYTSIFLTNTSQIVIVIPYSDRPIVRDIDTLASYDPVAIDKVSYDLINNEIGLDNSALNVIIKKVHITLKDYGKILMALYN